MVTKTKTKDSTRPIKGDGVGYDATKTDIQNCQCRFQTLLNKPRRIDKRGNREEKEIERRKGNRTKKMKLVIKCGVRTDHPKGYQSKSTRW